MKDIRAECNRRFINLESKTNRIEILIWYIAGAISIQFGSDILPVISALIN